MRGEPMRMAEREAGSLGVARLARVVAIVAAVAFAGSANTSRAQPGVPEITMVLSNPEPQVGEPFQVQVEARSASQLRGEMIAPSFGGLRLVGQTGQMQSQSVQHSFGQPPRIESRTMIGFVVVADRPGVFRVGPASFRMGRQTYSGDALVVKIGGTGQAEPADAGAPTPTPGAESMNFDPQFFLRAVVDRNEVVIGQQVTYTLYMYRRVDGQVQVSRQPSLDGFWSQDLPDRPNDPGDVQTVNGVQFRVHALLRRALFPTRVGMLDVGSPEITLQPRTNLFSFGQQDEPMRRGAPPIRVQVAALPGGLSPSAFVGEGQLSAEVDRTTLRTGEPGTLTVRLRGRGSMRLVELATPVVDGIRFDPPNIEDHPDIVRDVIGGERVFTFPFVATRPGTPSIPGFRLGTFDPTVGQPRELTTTPFRLAVTGAALANEEPVVADDAPGNEGSTEEALRFGPMSRSSAMRRRTAPVHTTRAFQIGMVSPLLLLASVLLVRGIRGAVAGAVARRDPRDAKRKDALKDARRAMRAADTAAFHGAITAALTAALDRAVGEPTAGLTRTELRALLQLRGADEDLVQRLLDELEGADFARFSASAGTREEMERTLARASALLGRIPALPIKESAA